MYRPEFEIVPTAGFPPVMLLTSHVTAVFWVLVTEAWNCSCLPAATVPDVGEIDTIGTASIVKFTGLDVPPPGAGVETVTAAVLGVATSAAVIAACKVVVATRVVARGLPFHCTVEDVTKLAPVTVSVNAASPAKAEVGVTEATVGAGFGLGVNALPLPPQPLRISAASVHTTNAITRHTRQLCS